MNVKKRLKEDLAKIELPVIESLEMKENTANHRTHVPFRLVAVMTALILASFVVVGALAAGTVVLIKNINAPLLTDGNVRLTEVPDKMTGIYTVADLAQLQNSEKTDDNIYILMSDITISDADYAENGVFAGGWTPVSVRIFNGNGYVIRNLKINDTVTDISESGISYAGLFSDAYSVRNLGIEGCYINVTANDTFINIGAVVGRALTVYGCYATDVTINVRLSESDSFIPRVKFCYNYVGGICGGAQYIDSCYTDAVIALDATESDKTKNFIGGISGYSFSAVTSYFDGSISGTLPERLYIDNIVADKEGLPALLTTDSYTSMMDTLRAKYPDIDSTATSPFDKYSFEVKKVMAYFAYKNLTTFDEELSEQKAVMVMVSEDNSFTFDDPKSITEFYLYDPYSSPQESKEIVDFIVKAYGSFDAFSADCATHNIKCGVQYCYGAGESDYSGFDFDRIWQKNPDGSPTLRIFG